MTKSAAYWLALPGASKSLKSRFTKLLFPVYASRKKIIRLGGGARSLNMHPEGASNCSWGNRRVLLRFTYAQGASYACKVDHASVLLVAS